MFLTLSASENQAVGLGQYALSFLSGDNPGPAESVFQTVERFHLDSIACGVSALALGTNAPRVLREEALSYAVPAGKPGVPCFGSNVRVSPEKAVLANCSAVREWDSNGTNFGYNPGRGHTRGEFGHNDFYPVAVAAAQLAGYDGRRTLLAMILLDEIRGRLAEVFSLKDHKIDHVVHGAIASAVTYGAVLGATPQQIESAIGLVVAHYIPFRAIRAGKQLSDSKGASAAISAEVAVQSMRRAMSGFVGPADIFRNPEAIFCLFEKPPQRGRSPFDLVLATGGDDFAVCGMHFKLGLYEHQSAGAIQGLMDLLACYPALLDDHTQLRAVRITIYQPAFGIIGDVANRRMKDEREGHSSADVENPIPALTPALSRSTGRGRRAEDASTYEPVAGWAELMLVPADYDDAALQHPLTRAIMDKIEFRHGGPEYDSKYPDGIPTTLDIEHSSLGHLTSGLVMYPEGHARNTSGNLEQLLAHKFRTLAALGVKDVEGLHRRFTGLSHKSASEIQSLYDFCTIG